MLDTNSECVLPSDTYELVVVIVASGRGERQARRSKEEEGTMQYNFVHLHVNHCAILGLATT